METTLIYNALQTFAQDVKEKLSQVTAGEPEDQLRKPLEVFLSEAATALGIRLVCTGETPLPDHIGRPDYAIHTKGLLTGYVELKAPGKGANPDKFKGHDSLQWNRFKSIPNVLYTDGSEWSLFRYGKPIGKMVRLSGNVAREGKNSCTIADAGNLLVLLSDFLNWEPIIPTDTQGRIILQSFAEILAPLCRFLRDEVFDAVKDPDSPLVHLAVDWRQLLFPNADDEQFADAYAQTVTFALLLARSEGADPLTLESAERVLAGRHGMISRALQVLTDSQGRRDISASLDLLTRVIGVVPTVTLGGAEDPWLYFYEYFLAVYDENLRKNAGAYYTPVEVVHLQVRLVNDLLMNRLGKPLGFCSPDVITLDPAVGTGTYLLGIIEHALLNIRNVQGDGAVADHAIALARNIFGFELLVGPYTVANVRVSRALQENGVELPTSGVGIYLTDTLENPYTEPPQTAFYVKLLADQQRQALRIKEKVPVIVCIGNPPYDRHEAATAFNRSRTGGWVRWGNGGKEESAILQDFLKPVLDKGYGVDAKNLYNLYIYFWRWAIWKVFEHPQDDQSGIVSFITASSYLDGKAFIGMREMMRRVCEEIWILDLDGEGRGTRREDNVFDIQTPVAVMIALRTKKKIRAIPATVHYYRIKGNRSEKFSTLDTIRTFTSIEWELCRTEWQAPFRPAGEGSYFTWPLLTDLMPWQQSGTKFSRTWPISPEKSTLTSRWKALLSTEDRRIAFKETRDRKVSKDYIPIFSGASREKSIAELPNDTPPPKCERYGYRSFDRQWVLLDARLGDCLANVLWRIRSERQVYFTSLITTPLGLGAALTCSAHPPDLHHFSGRGAKDCIALFRDHASTQPNILPGLLQIIGQQTGVDITAEIFSAYLYGILAQPAFTANYFAELETRELRVPITKNRNHFMAVAAIGSRLIWLHTFGERFIPEKIPWGSVPNGKARCNKSVFPASKGYPQKFHYNETTQALHVGDGEFAPVSQAVFEFEVSGLKVVQSWLKYRMKDGGGKKTSPLDDIRPETWTAEFTTELLELLWVLEATIAGYPEQERLLREVVSGDCFTADELPPVPESMRNPPVERESDMFDDWDES